MGVIDSTTLIATQQKLAGRFTRPVYSDEGANLRYKPEYTPSPSRV